MRIVLVAILCLVVTVFARPEESKLVEINSNAQPSELEELQEYLDNQPDEITRKKKSAVTTFCVEIRPTDQKPYQVCEPRGYGNSAPYYQNEGGYEHIKPQESFSSGSSTQSKPAPSAYSAPVKTYSSSGSSTVSKPAQAYGTYRSTKTEHEEEEEIANKPSAARASKPGGEKTVAIEPKADEAIHTSSDSVVDPYPAARKTAESDEDEEEDIGPMRAAHHQDPYSYGPGYGAPTSMIPVAPAHQGHSGLVITCQPNLAGYAHGVPGGYHDKIHAGVPAYNYRSAGGAYGRPYGYKPQPQPYGNYKPYAPRPVYRPQPQVYKAPVYSTPYSHPPPVYKPPVYAPPPHEYKPSEASEDHELFVSPEIKPAPMLPPGGEYGAPPPIYHAPPPSPIYHAPPPPPIYHAPPPPPPPPPVYQPPPPPPASYYPPPPPAPQPPPPAVEYRPAYTPPIDYKPPAYTPTYAPGAYRTADEKDEHSKNEDKISDKEKESHTLNKMEEISDKRVENSRRAGENKENNDGEAAREADQGNWRDAEHGNWRDAEHGNWRDAERENVGDPQGGWRDSVGIQSAGGWRNGEEPRSSGWRDAGSDQENIGNSANNEFRNSDIPEGITSIENKIEEN